MSAMKAIKHIVRDIPQHWVGDGFPVRSLFTYSRGNEYDPFLLLDYAGPHDFAPNEAKRGVGEHPHRGFETVTILYQGELEHRDSSGSHGRLGVGDVQWMTAASGVVHEEFHSEKFTREGGMLEMVQLWVNLPARDKMSTPRYQDMRDGQFPRVTLPDDVGTLRVIAGEFMGGHGPAKTFTPINIWDLQFHDGGAVNVNVPEGHTVVIVVQAGSVTIGGNAMRPIELALFEREGDTIDMRALPESRVLILTGEPLGEPIAGQGPFVMNTRAEIIQAIEDYQSGKMGTLSP